MAAKMATDDANDLDIGAFISLLLVQFEGSWLLHRFLIFTNSSSHAVNQIYTDLFVKHQVVDLYRHIILSPGLHTSTHDTGEPFISQGIHFLQTILQLASRSICTSQWLYFS